MPGLTPHAAARPSVSPVRGDVRGPGRPCRHVAGLAVSDWLIDKSALVRLANSPDATEWANRIERGLVPITTVTRLEVGYSARSGPGQAVGVEAHQSVFIPAVVRDHHQD